MENIAYKDEDSFSERDDDDEDYYMDAKIQQVNNEIDLKTISLKLENIQNGVTLSWEKVNVYSKKNDAGLLKKCFKSEHVERPHIVQNVDGIARPGELLAIMGASGAGKTTLLNVLNFRTRGKLRITGDVKVNGISVKSALQLASISGFVQQDDLFIGTLTVKEHLRFQAMLRMDKGTSYENRMRRIEEVLLDLNLKKCENTLIGVPSKNIKGISGGEKRRLGFATEVLTNPSLLFCDEPTSGLDSFMALSIVETMKRLADQGKTIICTIHQPSSEIFEMFDRLCLLAEGRLAYIGDREKAYDFFFSQGFICPPNYNPADYYIQRLAIVPSNREECQEKVKIVCDGFAQSTYMNDLSKDLLTIDSSTDRINNVFKNNTSFYKANVFTQMRWLIWRNFLATARDPAQTKIQFIQIVLLSVFFGLIFLQQKLDQDSVQNINGILFLCLTNNTFSNIFAVITTFHPEMPIFLREHYNGMYTVATYFLSKVTTEFPTFLALPLIFTGIVYWMANLNNDVGKFFLCCATIVIVANNAAAFGGMLSAVAPSTSVAVSLSSPIIVPLLIFSGYYLNNDSVPIYLIWMKYLSWLGYSYEILLINQWDDIDDIACDRNSTVKCRYERGDDVLKQFSMNKSNFSYDFLYMLLLYLACRLIAFFGLLKRSYSSK